MDKGKIMNDLNSVLNQLQGANCGCWSSGEPGMTCAHQGHQNQNMLMGKPGQMGSHAGQQNMHMGKPGQMGPHAGQQNMHMGQPGQMGPHGGQQNMLMGKPGQMGPHAGQQNMHMGQPGQMGSHGGQQNMHMGKPGQIFPHGGQQNMLMGQPGQMGSLGGHQNVLMGQPGQMGPHGGHQSMHMGQPGQMASHGGQPNMNMGQYGSGHPGQMGAHPGHQNMHMGHYGSGQPGQMGSHPGHQNMHMAHGNSQYMSHGHAGMMQGDTNMTIPSIPQPSSPMNAQGYPGAGENIQGNICPGLEMARSCMGENYTCCRHGINGGISRCCRYGDLGGLKFSQVSPGALSNQKQSLQQPTPPTETIQPPPNAVDAQGTESNGAPTNQPNIAAAVPLNQVAGGDNEPTSNAEATPIVQEPIYPADTTRSKSPVPRQYYDQNALGQPVQLIPPERYHSTPVPLPHTIYPAPAPINQYQSMVDPMKQHYVKSTVSKTSIPRRSTTRIPGQHNLNRGSLSSTGRTVKVAAQGGSSSDGRLHVAPPKDQTPRPIETMAKVAGDATSGQKDEAPATKLESMPEGTIMKESQPPLRKGKHNGLQDRNFTNSPNSSWSFGSPLQNYAQPYAYQRYASPDRRR